MHKLAFVSCVALAACGGSSPSDPFVGSWACTGTSQTVLTQPINMTVTGASDSTVVITDDGNGNLTSVRTPGDGAPVCTLHSTLNADKVSTDLAANQSCTDKNGNTVSYTSGHSIITSTGYSAASAWKLSGMTANHMTLAGTGSGMSSCSKM